MQNLPIACPPPAAQTQAPATPDNSAGPAAEPFGSVLARQRASSREPAENGQTAAASAGGTPGSAGSTDATGNNENTDEAPALAPGVTEDLLATLYLPAGLAGSAATTSDKSALPAHEINTGAVLTSDAGAVLLSAATAVQQSATPPGAAAIGSETRPTVPAQFRAQDYSAAVYTDTSRSALRGDTFQAVPEMFENETVHPALSHDSTRASAPLALTDAVAAALPQTGAVTAAPSAGGVTQLRMDTPLTGNSWSEEFGQKIIWMAAQRGQIAELHLNPPDLGPLDVVLSVSDGQATAIFSSPHAAVRNAVEQALPKLREMLADNGIMLGNATVGDQQPRERQAGLEDGRQNEGSWPARTSTALPAGSTHGNAAVWAGRRHDGMVDIFA